MTTKTMHVRGVLTPTNRGAVTENTAEMLDEEASSVALWFAAGTGIKFGEDGTLEFNNFVEVNESHHAILGAVNRLSVLLEQERVVELGLEGHLMVTADTSDEPVVMRVTVREGKVFYQDAHITWSGEVPF